MAEFYIEKGAKETGERVVHSATCSSLPAKETLTYLGAYSNANAPVNKATDYFGKVTTCPDCIAAA